MPDSRVNATGRTGHTSSIPMQQMMPNSAASQTIPSSSPPPPTTSSTTPQTQSSSSALASSPPPPAVSPLAPSCSPSQVSTSHSTTPSTPPSTSPSTPPQQSTTNSPTTSCPPTPGSTPGQTPASGTTSPQQRSFLSTWTSALWQFLRKNYKIIIKGLVASTIAFLGVYYAVLTFPYTKWTQRNDFRDGCINDQDHDLPMAVGCVAELARPRIAAVNMKRHIKAVRHASLETPLYWTIAIFIPVLTCLFYLVWMRVFARDGPKPVVSLARIYRDNYGHGLCGIRPAAQANDASCQLSRIRDDDFHEHLQQTSIDATSDSDPEEDYFQSWKDKMKSRQVDEGDDDGSETDSIGSILSNLGAWVPSPLPVLPNALSIPANTRRGSLSQSPGTASSSGKNVSLELFEVEFQPSGKRVRCEYFMLDGPASGFQPLDGVKLDLKYVGGDKRQFVLKCPLEHGATFVTLLRDARYRPIGFGSMPFALQKRTVWARRLGSPGHRFLYLVVSDVVTRHLGQIPGVPLVF